MLLLLAAREAPVQVPVFPTGIEVVRLDVSVTRDGAPVLGLAAADFEVLDDGVPQAVRLVAREATTIHAVLALDTSSSVAGQTLARLKAAAHRFVDALDPGDALSLLTFSECIDLTVVQSQKRDEAHAAIELATTRRTTSLHDASLASLTLTDPALGRPLVLVFSDGQDVGSWTAPERVLALARDSEAVVHAVVPSAANSAGILPELTALTGGRIWQTADGDTLEDVFLKALEEFRSRYRLQYEPRSIVAAGTACACGSSARTARCTHAAATRTAARASQRVAQGYFRLSRYSAIARTSDSGSFARFSWIAAMPPLERSS